MENHNELFYNQGVYTITGFINSHGELEFSILSDVDGGCLTLEDRKYHKEELLDFLSIELKKFIAVNK